MLKDPSHLDFMCFYRFSTVLHSFDIRHWRCAGCHYLITFATIHHKKSLFHESGNVIFWRIMPISETIYIDSHLPRAHCFDTDFLCQQHQNNFPRRKITEELLVTSRWPSSARDVTAAMLVVKNKSISLLWELNYVNSSAGLQVTSRWPCWWSR